VVLVLVGDVLLLFLLLLLLDEFFGVDGVIVC
jgi:hypothetical protein